MKRETIAAGNDILSEIDYIDKHLKNIARMNHDIFQPRVTYLQVNGFDNTIAIPQSMFKLLGKHLEVDYMHQKNKWLKKLDELK